jgi:NAD(P)H-hydrate epimerase
MRDFDRKLSVHEMQIHDKNSSDYGINPRFLMECAGYSAANSIIVEYKLKKNDGVLVVCGTGNNGGDGFVIARHLLAAQMNVTILLVGTPDSIHSSEAQLNWNILQKLLLGIRIQIVKDSSFFQSIPKDFITRVLKTKVVIDCLLGTGVKGKIREPIRSAIDFLNWFSEKDQKIISIDVPSGIDPNTGKKSDVYVKPNLLITFHREKTGFTKISDCKIITNPIGIPREADLFVGSGDLLYSKPKRSEFAHKGQYGKILIIGGSEHYSGAPALAGMAALQMGVDLVYVFAPKSVSDIIQGYSPNLIVRSGYGASICQKDLPIIEDLIEKVDSVIIGPGLGTHSDVKDSFPKIISALKKHNKPFVVDANAIVLLKSLKDEISGLKIVITPHANEFYQLMGKKMPDQEQFDKTIRVLEKTAKEWNVTFLIKGRYDYITNGKTTRINKTGVPQMSVGGTGDILTGIIATFLALGIDSFLSACNGAYISGKLGERHQNRFKNKSLKSSDLLEFIPEFGIL